MRWVFSPSARDLDGATTGDRYQVVLHVDATALPSAGERAGEPPSDPAAGQAVVELNDGAMNVSAETSLRIACDEEGFSVAPASLQREPDSA